MLLIVNTFFTIWKPEVYAGTNPHLTLTLWAPVNRLPSQTIYTSKKRLLQVDFIGGVSALSVYCMPHGSSEYFLIIGSIIFESNKINSTKQEWRISSNDRVALTFVKQTYQIRLLTVVDLDVTNVRRTSRYLLLKIPISWFIFWFLYLMSKHSVYDFCSPVITAFLGYNNLSKDWRALEPVAFNR